LTVETEPKTARGRERKGAIIEVAAVLMYERGVRATGLQDVLAESRSGKSQFYHYFSSKDELVAAVLEYQLMIVLGELEEFRVDTWKGIRSWFDALLDGQEQRGFKGCPVGSLSHELSAGDRCMQGRVADAFSRWESALARAFAAMKARRSLDNSARPQTLAETTLAAIQGGYLLSTVHHDIAPMRTALAAAYTELRATRPAARLR